MISRHYRTAALLSAPPQSTDIRPRRGTAGLVGFMTIRPASPSRPFFTPMISLAKIIFRPSPLTIFVRRCQIPSRIKTRASAPHQPADPWQGGLPNRGCGRENGKPAEIACLSLMPEKESDMARPKQSEPSLSVDRRQLLASAAALSIGTVPGS